MKAFIRKLVGSAFQPVVAPSIGISSATPLPLGSPVLNAFNTSYSSSVVVGGKLSPSFSNHGWYIQNLIEYWQWKQPASSSGRL